MISYRYKYEYDCILRNTSEFKVSQKWVVDKNKGSLRTNNESDLQKNEGNQTRFSNLYVIQFE